MTLGTATTLSQMIPVIVLSGAIAGLAKGIIPSETREQAVKSFNEVSEKEAVDAVGWNSIRVAKKNPDAIFRTDRGDVMYSDGRYFVR